jgi:hypothetical protein
LHVCDGQQRLTTLSLLLGAIRAVSLSKNGELVDKINDLLFHDVAAYQAWAASSSVKDIQDGQLLDFFRIIPTYCDRKQFYLAILDTKNEVGHVQNSLIE